MKGPADIWTDQDIVDHMERAANQVNPEDMDRFKKIILRTRSLDEFTLATSYDSPLRRLSVIREAHVEAPGVYVLKLQDSVPENEVEQWRHTIREWLFSQPRKRIWRERPRIQ